MRHLLVWIPCLFLLLNLEGVIWRHDVPEKLFRELGKASYFLPVGSVYCRGINSTGTLISPTCVVVSAHAIIPDAVTYFNIYNPTNKHFERIRGVAKRHLEYSRSFDENKQIASVKHDIGVVLLDRPVEGITPAKLWFKRLEEGTPCSCCGFGKPGTGLTGPGRSDFRKRAFTNTLAENIRDTSQNEFYAICFNSPRETPSITPLEGIGSSGDSGAPVFVNINGEHVMIGILSLLIRKGFYQSLNTILPLIEYEEWFENIDSMC